MKKNILIVSRTIMVIAVAFIAGYLLGKNYTTTKPEEEKYAYYCEVPGGFKVWVNPEYNDYPMYGAAKAFEEKYNNTFHPNSINCQSVSSP